MFKPYFDKGRLARWIRRETLDKELEKCVTRTALLDIDIAVMEQLDPGNVVRKNPLKVDANGNPMSFQELTAAELLVVAYKEKKGLEFRLQTIAKLLKT